MVAFSTAFAVGSSVAGMFGSNKAAKQQAKQLAYQNAVAEQARKDNLSNAAAMTELGAYNMRIAEEQNEYRQELARQQNLAEQERQRYLRGFDVRNEERLTDQINRTVGRQAMTDELEGDRREFELERIARDDKLTRQEREFALAELQRERDRARRQRREEQRRMDRGDQVVADEYQERLRRLDEDKLARQEERRFEIDRQNQAIGQAVDTRNRMRGVLDEYGRITAPELAGADDISRLSNRYYDQYSQEVDQALDRNLSTLEADLIRKGMQGGGSSNAQRAEILARIAPQFMRARADANTQAGREVAAENQIAQDRFKNLREALGVNLDAEQQVGTTGLDIQARLSNPSTSGVLDRDVGSAYNAYTSRGPSTSMVGVSGPLDIDSQIRSIGNLSQGYGSTLNMPTLSMAGTQASGYAAMPNLNTPDANTFFQQGSTALNSNATNAQASADKAYDRTADAYRAAGSAGADVVTSLGSFLDEKKPGGIFNG
jgi:hypothetical protein